MVIAGDEWVYVRIVREIAAHYKPEHVLFALKHFKKVTVLAIAIIIMSFGAGMVVMDQIRKHASKKEIDEAMRIVSLAKRGEC